MAFVLQLTDGTTTIDFMTEDYHVEDGGLQISTPEKVQTWTEPSSAGGKKLTSNKYGNRTIDVTFHVSGTTRALIRDKINAINIILQKAIDHSLGNIPDRVTLRYAWDGVSEVSNFEVFSGDLTLPDDVLSVEMLQSTWTDTLNDTYYRVRGCQLELTVSPDAYGVDPSTGSLIELPLTNRNGTDVTGGIIVKPFTDTRSITAGGYYIDSYVEIDGADIDGDMLAKTRIEIQYQGTNPKIDRILIGAHEKNTAKLFYHWTDANFTVYHSGSQYLWSTYMGGSTFNTTAFSPSQLLYQGAPWMLNIVNPENFKSEHYRLLWHTGATAHTTSYLHRAILGSTDLTPIVKGPYTTNYYGSSNRVGSTLDMGVLQVPPHSNSIPNPADLRIYPELRATQAGLANYYSTSICYVALFPVELGYRVLRTPDMIGNYVNPTLIDDSWANISYIDNSGYDGSRAVVEPMFTPVALSPGKTIRIYFHMQGQYYIPSNAENWKVKVYYSPAYLGAV